MVHPAPTGSFGANAGLVDEMYERYRSDPSSVSASWRDFFDDYRPEGDRFPLANGTLQPTSVDPIPAPAPTPAPAPAAPTPAAPTPAAPTPAAPTPAAPAPVEVAPTPGAISTPPIAISPSPTSETPAPVARPLRGAAKRIAANMEASLAVPTATSTRVVPARLLEVNRKVINGYLGRIGATRISFTHLIGYAVVRALDTVPAMKSTYLETDDGPAIVAHDHVGLGLAVDVPKADGTRTLLVPCIRSADALDFAGFHAAYEDLIRRIRANRIGPDDFAGVTMTLTNPGTLGTVASVPRLMPGQSVIVGIGALGYGAEFEGSDKRVLAEMGISKTVSLSSTYDHRVIQGAESGMFLAQVHELLCGADGFYKDVFRSLGVPYEAVRWRPDVNPPEDHDLQRVKQVHVQTLINMYRVRGHLIADLDPLQWKEPRTHPELDPATYGLTIWDLDREFYTDGVGGHDLMTLGDLLHVLRDAYCRRIGVEYMHIQEPEQKRWIQEQVEGVPAALETAEQLYLLGRLNAAEAFERFLHTKYLGHKRFGLEGAESVIPLVDELLDQAAVAGIHEAVLGMAHRGRLNVLANIVGKPLRKVFREFEGNLDPETTQGSGDVKYHLGATGKFVGRSGQPIPVTLASNPSHLEAVDPVVEGMVRARQDLIGDPGPSGIGAFAVLPLVIHGDAAFAGQGVVAETLNLSALRGYRVGGTIHLVVNNQLGFTTAPEEARSSVYPTDVAKMVQAPIFHVNGDDPEACLRVARMAFGFRQRFHKDVVIDMVCYRRHGHNEGDDPSYTQPLMYKRIESRRSVRKLYTETLVRRGDITADEAEKALDDFLARMQAAFEETRQSAPPPAVPPRPTPIVMLPPVDTGVARSVLDKVAGGLHTAPEGFTVHPKLAGLLETRHRLYRDGQVDWSLAEALAFGSLLLEGVDIRLAGQDTRRGTFSQRHSVLVDSQTGYEHVPLGALGPAQGRFRVYDSLLSEYAALGFEYGYSTVHTAALVAWEAQFGDFGNGAQIVIDQFIAAAESKWGQSSGLVLLLPHGYEGQGPEHSSARIERYLTLCAGDNLQVVNATSAAQYFHVLRRQVRRVRRRPLVMFTPKSLLRAHSSRSPVSELIDGRFHEVLDDPAYSRLGGDQTSERPDSVRPDSVRPDSVRPDSVRRVVLASGKVGLDAIALRDQRQLPAAVVRMEQLYPWPGLMVLDTISHYPNATEVVWLQEEPENMGPWNFVSSRLARLLPEGLSLRHVTRTESASPASGSQTVHQHEQAQLLERTFVGL